MVQENSKYNNNDIDWFKSIFELHYDSVRNYVYFKCANLALADEVAKATFLRLWELKGKLKQGYQKSLPYTIASRMFLKRRSQFNQAHVINLQYSVENTESSIVQNRITFKQYEYLLEAVRYMPVSVRVVLLMHLVEGISMFDIAERLQMRLTKVEGRMAEAFSVINKKGLTKQLFDRNYTEVVGFQKQQETLLGWQNDLSIPPSIEKEKAWEQIVKYLKREEWLVAFRKKVLPWGGFVIIAILVLSVLYDWQFAKEQYEVPYGKTAFLMLPDSTLVAMNAGTTIEYRRYGWKWRRTVKLYGEAHFSVNHRENSFTIALDDNYLDLSQGSINVYYRDSYLDVKCISGNVSAEVNNLPPLMIAAGQGLLYSPNQSYPHLRPIDAAKATLWKRGAFQFTNTPLVFVLKEIERQFDIEIQTQSIDVETIKYSGYFTNENLTTALDLICTPLGLDYNVDYRNNSVLILSL